MRVCHLITNPYTLDTRVRKECATLRDMGCDVVVVGTMGRGRPARERDQGVRVVRIRPEPGTFRRFGRLLGLAARDRFGGNRAWDVVDGIAAGSRRLRQFGRSVANVARHTVRRVLGRLPETEGPPPGLEHALATESRMPLTAHLAFWLGTAIGLVVVLLLPVLLLLAPVLALLLTAARLLIGGAGWLWRRLAAGVSRSVNAVRPTTRRVHADALKVMGPVRQRIFRIARAMELIDAAYRADANVYQANDYDTLMATWITSRLRGVPFVYDIHELYDESFPTRKPFRTRYTIRLVEGRLIRRALRTITVGDEIARIMHERYRVPRPAVIRNAQPYEGRPDPLPILRERIGDGLGTGSASAQRRMLFVYAGRVAKGRGLEESVDAMRLLDPDEAALVILGDGDPQRIRSLQAKVRAHGLEDRVYLLPAIPSDELPNVLADADVGLMLTMPVCLSYYYGLGNKMFHYVNAGIPVLVPRQPEKVRFVETHGVGTCCETLTPEGIAEAMQRMIDAPSWVDALKERCHEVAPLVSWQREAATYRAIYEDVYERILFADPVRPAWSLA